MSKFLRSTLIALFFAPMFAHAMGVIDIFILFTDLITELVPLLIGIAVVVFFWGIVKFIYHADDERERQSGKDLMIWGMIALFVMVSLWSIVGFLQESLVPTSAGTLGDLPTIPDTIPTP